MANKKKNTKVNAEDILNAISSSTNNWTILSACEFISSHAEDSALSDDFFTEVADPLSYLRPILGLSDIQCVIISYMLGAEPWIDLSDLAAYVGISKMQMLSYCGDFDSLAENGWLVECVHDCDETSDSSYRLAAGISKAFAHNKPFTPDIPRFESSMEFIMYLSRFAGTMVEQSEYARCRKFFNWALTVLKSNAHLPLCSLALSLERKLDRVFLMYLASETFSVDGHIVLHDIPMLFGNHDRAANLMIELTSGRHPLMLKGIVRIFKNEEGFDSIRFTDKALETLFSGVEMNHDNDGPCKLIDDEIESLMKSCQLPDNDDDSDDDDEDIFEIKRSSNTELIKFDDIKPKALFYNAGDESGVNRLASLLSQDNLPNVQKRLTERGLRSGFACLLYGAPGTGKTETVLQIARQTGRDVIQVDISAIYDKYIGETEKNIKRVFDYYREVCSKVNVTPILLFNESDAIISKRIEKIEHTSDQTTNAVQNILLQEIERLEGILVATTNLTSNLDKAFERRFIYKIEFHKPDLDTKAKIWNSLIPEISESDARALASDYDFSGGQIENISRKCEVDYILNGVTNDLSCIKQLCSEECIENTTKRAHIGF